LWIVGIERVVQRVRRADEFEIPSLLERPTAVIIMRPSIFVEFLAITTCTIGILKHAVAIRKSVQ